MQASKDVQGDRSTRLGVLSDSHGEAERTRRAVELLRSRGATTIIHCGDIESLECIDSLAGLDAHLVFGNCDDESFLGDYAADLGVRVHGLFGSLEIGGTPIAFGHSHDDAFWTIADRVQPAWLFHGHTHSRCDYRRNGMRVVNPGALAQPKPQGAPLTVACVGVADGTVEFLEVPVA